MRVLHVHSGNLYGGVETTLMKQFLHRHLYQDMEMSFALCFEGQFSRELMDAGAPVHWLKKVRVRNPLAVRAVRRSLSELLKHECFDVVVTHSLWSHAIFARVVRAASLPVVLHLHGPVSGKHWLERWARRTIPDLVICNSHFTASTLTRLYPHARAEVIYNPLISSETVFTDEESNAVRAELKTPEKAVVIVQVSRMESLKGQATLIEALSRLKDLPGWICWQIGGAQRPCEIRYEENLKEMAARLGIADRVHFLGHRSDVPHLLAATDIYCQPNTSPESFGNTFIEAMMMRLPIITSNIGGAREIIDDSCGLLVLPNDSQSLSASLSRLIQDKNLRTKLGAAGPARARELCDLSKQMARFHMSLARLCR